MTRIEEYIPIFHGPDCPGMIVSQSLKSSDIVTSLWCEQCGANVGVIDDAILKQLAELAAEGEFARICRGAEKPPGAGEAPKESKMRKESE